MDFSLAALRIAHRTPVASLHPSVVNYRSYEISGSALPEMFHAGSNLVEEITTDIFFDGWYGWGFYAAFDPEYVRRWYGPIVTRLRAVPTAKVLIASVSPGLAPPGLFDKAMKYVDAKAGDEAKAEEMRGYILENQLLWVHAVDEVAIEEYDIVVYSNEQIVIKTPESVIVEGEYPLIEE